MFRITLFSSKDPWQLASLFSELYEEDEGLILCIFCTKDTIFWVESMGGVGCHQLNTNVNVGIVVTYYRIRNLRQLVN